MSVFYVCVCKWLPNPRPKSASVEQNILQILAAAVRIECRDFEEAQNIVSKAEQPSCESLPSDWMNELYDEYSAGWKEFITCYKKAIESDTYITKIEEESEEESEWRQSCMEEYRRQQSVETEMIRRYALPEDEALKTWDAIALAAAQHQFDLWRHMPRECLSDIEKQAFTFLHKCASIAGYMQNQSKEVLSRLPIQKKMTPDLRTVLDQYPFPRTAEEGKLWIRVSEVAAIEKTVNTATLKRYRDIAPAEKTPDGFAGRDKDGRIWRKAGPNKQILYLISSLKNKPK